jgi:hypothetical protein
MAIAGFVKSIDTVENLGSDVFRLSCSCILMDGNNSTFVMSFDAQKGADWKIQCRTAFEQTALANFGETVDLVILPGLDTL